MAGLEWGGILGQVHPKPFHDSLILSPPLPGPCLAEVSPSSSKSLLVWKSLDLLLQAQLCRVSQRNYLSTADGVTSFHGRH